MYDSSNRAKFLVKDYINAYLTISNNFLLEFRKKFVFQNYILFCILIAKTKVALKYKILTMKYAEILVLSEKYE